MKTCYLAGPMRNLPGYNFPAFHAASADLRTQGWTVFNPAERDEELHPELDFTNDCDLPPGFMREALTWDIGSVVAADAVVVLPGWRRSNGVFLELTVAFGLEKNILEYPSLRPAILPMEITHPADAYWGNQMRSYTRQDARRGW